MAKKHRLPIILNAHHGVSRLVTSIHHVNEIGEIIWINSQKSGKTKALMSIHLGFAQYKLSLTQVVTGIHPFGFIARVIMECPRSSPHIGMWMIIYLLLNVFVITVSIALKPTILDSASPLRGAQMVSWSTNWSERSCISGPLKVLKATREWGGGRK